MSTEGIKYTGPIPSEGLIGETHEEFKQAVGEKLDQPFEQKKIPDEKLKEAFERLRLPENAVEGKDFMLLSEPRLVEGINYEALKPTAGALENRMTITESGDQRWVVDLRKVAG